MGKELKDALRFIVLPIVIIVLFGGLLLGILALMERM